MLICAHCGSTKIITENDLIDINKGWGTYGKGAIEEHTNKGTPLPKMKIVKLKDCSTEHLKAILKKCQLDYQTRETIHYILNERQKFERDLLGDKK